MSVLLQLHDILVTVAKRLHLPRVHDLSTEKRRSLPERLRRAPSSGAPGKRSIADGEHLLQDRRFSSLQRQVLTEDNERKRRLIAQLLEGPPE